MSVSAIGSSLGYSYQELYALLTALDLEDNSEISIERFDDFAIEKDGIPKKLVQTKQHKGSTKLGNTSEDLWKTIGNWAEDYGNGRIDPRNTKLLLVTTSIADSGSIASLLKPYSRDPVTARNQLNDIAKSSKPSSNKIFYEKYLHLDDLYRRYSLIENIVIIDGESDISQVIEKIEKRISGLVEKKYHDILLHSLLGWWHKRVISHLKDQSDKPIQRNEINAQIRNVILQCSNDSLPIFSIDTSESEKISEKSNFVKQLEIIDKNESIKNAKRNYFLAMAHRSKWIRYDPLNKGVIDKFDDELKNEWDEKYTKMMKEITKSTSEKIRKSKGSNLFDWANDEADYLNIKPNTRDHFIRRGFFHRLSTRLDVGWHPDFRKLLTK